MQGKINISREVAFDSAAMLDQKHDPWFKRKEKEQIYAHVLIASCQQNNWWYAPFVGMEVFVLLVFEYHYKKVRAVHCVRIVGVKIHTGRDIDPKDIILI